MWRWRQSLLGELGQAGRRLLLCAALGTVGDCCTVLQWLGDVAANMQHEHCLLGWAVAPPGPKCDQTTYILRPFSRGNVIA